MFADDDEEDLHLVVHVLQPLQSQVGDDARRAIVNWQNIDLELLWSSCHYLETKEDDIKNTILKMVETLLRRV